MTSSHCVRADSHPGSHFDKLAVKLHSRSRMRLKNNSCGCFHTDSNYQGSAPTPSPSALASPLILCCRPPH